MHVPALHRRWLDEALPVLRADARLLGVAAGGSWARDELDEWSDLDLVVLVDPERFDDVLADRRAIASACGELLSLFTAEHVGEPDMVIGLYGPPLLHVDLKFIRPDRLSASRVEDPAILWERDGALTAALSEGVAAWPAPEPQAIEDRIWTWLHYLGCKCARGELLECVGGLAYIRTHALAPLIQRLAGFDPQGVRRLETRAPEHAGALQATLGGFERSACIDAALALVAQYRALRKALGAEGPTPNATAEEATVTFLEDVASLP